MGIFFQLFKKLGWPKPYNPEEEYTVTISESSIQVEHPKRATEQILWNNIVNIKLVNTDQGPYLPDIWLVLSGKNDGCIIPHGSKGFDKVYDIVSKYEGFNFENFIKSMRCTGNTEFPLWTRDQFHE